MAQKALAVDRHYWLEREIIEHYADVCDRLHSEPVQGQPDMSLPGISTLGLDDILLRDDDAIIHPEVLEVTKRYEKRARRIALVLPPVFTPRNRPVAPVGSAINQGSPPLGLGQIAAYLSSLGHFVKLFDAHRTLYDHRDLVVALQSYHVVGFNLVLSTLKSAARITSDVAAAASKEKRPTIVIGGQAPTLMPVSELLGDGLTFDFAVVGPGEEALAAIVASDIRQSEDDQLEILGVVRRTPQISALNEAGVRSAVRNLAVARTSRAAHYQDVWNTLPWVDRRVFGGHSVSSYEPTVTRAGIRREAHVVLSRGCDWNCTFCTEGLVAGSYGENRRSVEDVVGELQYLVLATDVESIQFIDDNVFPVVGMPGRRISAKVADRCKWVRQLLANLADLKIERPEFSWRGLMRIEDLTGYATLIDSFGELLRASGCHLLSFGVEVGSDDLRASLKNAEPSGMTNAIIVDKVSWLKGLGIFSKGYFILGGPGQSEADITRTVDFAISAGFDIAYFAIYKDFRRILHEPADAKGLIDFQVFASGLDRCLMSNDALVWDETFGPHAVGDREQLSTEYAALRGLGFRFDSMIKYNDYHAASSIYEEFGFADTRQYLQAVAAAYCRFYCRHGWSETYKLLLAAGY